jgi:hypothetical protein
MRNISIVILLFLCIVSSGCARNIKLTYHSDPPGASLYQGSQFMGYCPTTLVYAVSPNTRQTGYMFLKDTEVKWISGATATISKLRANLATGEYQQFTFMRPTGIDGKLRNRVGPRQLTVTTN